MNQLLVYRLDGYDVIGFEESMQCHKLDLCSGMLRILEQSQLAILVGSTTHIRLLRKLFRLLPTVRGRASRVLPVAVLGGFWVYLASYRWIFHHDFYHLSGFGGHSHRIQRPQGHRVAWFLGWDSPGWVSDLNSEIRFELQDLASF